MIQKELIPCISSEMSYRSFSLSRSIKIALSILYFCSFSLFLQGQVTIISEDFSTGTGTTPPAGWTNNQAAGASYELWEFLTIGGFNAPMAGNIALFDSDFYGNNGTDEDVSLESPVFDAGAYTTLVLTFDHFFQGGFGGEYYVDVYNGSSWTNILSGTSTISNSTSESFDITTAANGASDAQIRFRWRGNWSWYWGVDNVELEGTVPVAVDTDGDTVLDNEDLDDDNDGILDTEECPAAESFSANISSGASNTFNFSSGDAFFLIDIYSLDNSFNVTVNGVNLANEIQFDVFFTGDNIARFSDGFGYGENGVPQIWSLGGGSSDVDVRLTIDEGGNLALYGAKSGGGTLLPMTLTNAPLQAIWNSSGGNTITIGQNVLGPTSFTGLLEFYQFACDTDSDGVNNHLDLDSDNDGIWDAAEAGHSETITAGRITGTVGANGLDNAVETSVDNGVLNYTVADTDTDNLLDAWEIDADNDACNDTNEEDISDLDSDGIAGTGTPTVDADGLVTSISYVSPVNNDWQNASIIGCEDSDNDGIFDFSDLDDDNDGILDTDECLSSAINGTETGGVTNTINATGTPDGNFALIKGGDVLTLELASTVNTGDIVTLYIARENTGGTMNITSSTTSGGPYSNNLTFNGGTVDVIAPVAYTISQDGVNFIRFTRTAGQLRVDAVTFCGGTDTDTDNDGIPDRLDLDSDNDGIFDLDEAGHTATDANDDGIIDGAVSLFGTNGFFDALETSTDNGIPNYTLLDSESDGTNDAYDRDADGDTCNDTNEVGISDLDGDGIVGIGTPTVDANGLVTSITYTSPLNTNWQNASANICSDSDGDGIDNITDLDDDNDGILDCIEKRLAISPFSDVFTINGDATQISTTELQITADVLSQGGSAFSNNQVDFSKDFSFSFEVNLGSNNSGADGLAIVFHNDPAGASAIGINGMGLAARGLVDGIVLEIDTYDNGTGAGVGDIANDHTMIWDTDNQAGAGLLTTAVAFGNLENGAWRTVVITWDATTQTIAYTLAGTLAGTLTTDLITNYFGGANLVHFGFSGSTGGLSNDQRIRFSSGFCDFQVSVDDDNDGIENHLDLDSDNDGIWDAVEAGHSEAITNGRITGAVGANGVDDNVETSIDSGSLNYTITNTDGDGDDDFLDLDSDDDTCVDAIEGAGSFTAANVDVNGALTGGIDIEGIPLVASGGQATTADVTNASNSSQCGGNCTTINSNRHLIKSLNY